MNEDTGSCSPLQKSYVGAGVLGDDLELGRKAILVSDDNGAILKFIASALEKLGYGAFIARTPIEALEIAQEKGDEIALHIVDLSLPGMDGRDLHRRILKHCPKIKCLLISGYLRENIEANGGLPKWAYFLPKPFRIEDLEAKLNRVFWNIDNERECPYSIFNDK